MNEGSSSSITRLNVSPNNLDDQISIKISKITSNPIASEKTLNEIRNLIFYIPITKIEEATQGIAEKILNVAIQTNSVQSSKEIDNFRHELLSLLNTLNYHFNGSIPKERLTTFFNYISDGSISDLTDALPIIRQTFEAGLNKQFLHEIAKLTISSCSKRIRWLHQNFDSIDSTYFNPFLTLLTVISFCARTFEDLRDQFISIFSSIEEIISKDFQDDTINYSTLPLLALKARMIHCYSLSADILFKNKSLSFLIDSYISILQKCPLSFHLLYEEIAWSFVCLISSKKDPVILQKYIEIFPSLTDFTICDIDFYISRQTIVNKLFETIILSPKCNWNIFQNVIEIMLRFSINSLFVNSIQYIQRISRFQKTIVYIFNKIKDMPPQANYRYHFSILFALHQLIKSMDETAKYEIKTSNEKSFDFNDIQHIISIVSNLFESISKVLECLIAVFESLTELRLRNEKITQSNIPSLPFSQIEIQYVHKIFSNLIFLLVDVRFLSSKCNFRYASQCINSDPKNNSKMCVIHLKLLKCYERVKKCISYIFQSFPKILKKYFHPLFMQNFWNGFFTEFFKRNENVLTNSSFVHSFYLDVVTFSYIIISLLQKCIDELNNPTKGSMVIQTVQQILHKINSQPDHRFDTKEKYVTIALMMMQKKVINVIYVFQSRVEAIPNITEAISFIIEIFTMLATFFKKHQNIPDFLNPRFIDRMIIVANQTDVGPSLISFFQFANKFAPKNIEFHQVVDLLIRPPYCGIRSLFIIYSIGKRNKNIVYGDKERMRRLLNLILNALPKAKDDEKAVLLKIMKKLPTSRTITADESGLKPTFILNNDQFSIPAIDLIEGNVKSIFNSPSNEELWIQLKSYLRPIFGINNHIKYINGFKNYDYDHKISRLLVPLLRINREKAFSLFFDLSVESLSFFANILVTLSNSSFNFNDSESLKFFSILKTQEDFTEFLKKILFITDIAYPNVFFIRNNIINNIIKNVARSVIDPVSFALFVVNAVSNRFLPRRINSFPGNRFLFYELEISVPEVPDLIERAKEYLSRSYSLTKQSNTIFFDYIANSHSKFNRYLYGEFASVCTDDDDADQFMNELFDKFFTTNLYHFIKISSILIRISPSLIDKHLDQFDNFLKVEIANTNTNSASDKEKREIVNDFLCSLVRHCPDFLCKYENRFFEIICCTKDFYTSNLPLFKIIKDSIPDSLFKRLKDHFIQRLRDDNIDNLMNWENFTTAKLTCFGKWDSIDHYWPIAFTLFPSEITPTTIRQLSEVIKNFSDQGIEFFHIICRLLVNEDVICYLVSENRYEVLMSYIIQALCNYNLAIDKRDLRILIDAIAFANDAGIRFLRTAIRNEKKFAFIQIAFEEEEHSKSLKEIILSDKDFVQSVLKVEPNSIASISQLSFSIASLSDENLFCNPEIYEIVFKFFINNLRCDGNCLVYVEHFIHFLTENISKLTRNDILIALIAFFNTNSQVVIAMIYQLIEEITKENSSFKIEELISLKFITNDIAYVFLKTVILPFIKNKNCNPEEFLSLIEPFKDTINPNQDINSNTNNEGNNNQMTVENERNNTGNRVDYSYPFNLYLHAILHLINEVPTFSVTTDKAYELFCHCQKANEKHIVFEIWSKSKGESHFETFFKSFLDSISVYISSYQKAACDNIKFPKNIPIPLLNPLVKAIINYQKSSSIIVSLWTIISNNLDCIPKPLSILWPIFIQQTLNLKHFAKKRQINSLTPLIAILTNLICSSPPPENKEHQVIIFFSNFVIFSLRVIIEQPQPTLKMIIPIIKSAKKLVKQFGPQVNIVNSFFKVIFEAYQKSLKQQYEIFQILMHFVSKMIKCAILYDGTIDFDPICDMVFHVVCIPDSPSWPPSYIALDTLLNNKKCIAKVASMMGNINSEDIWIRLSSIFWKHQFPEDIILTKLLPFARRVFKTENADPSTAKFMLTCLLVTIINNPYGEATKYLRDDLKNPVFRTFFMKYFVILRNLKPYVITSVGSILKKEGLNLDLIDAANPELKSYLSKKKEKTNTYLTQLEGCLDETLYTSLSDWKTASDLPEYIRDDYMHSFLPFSSVKTDLRHNLHLSIFQDMQNQKDIQNIPPIYIDTLNDIFDKVTTTKAELDESIQNLPLNPLILYDIKFAKFLMISSAMKKKRPFSRTLSPFYSPIIHQSLFNFIQRQGINDSDIYSKFSSKLNKSLQTSFCEPRPPKPDIEFFVKNNSKSLENLILSLSSKIKDIEWTEIIFCAAQNGLRLKSKNPIFLTAIIRLLPLLYDDKMARKYQLNLTSPIDPFWSVFFIEFFIQNNVTDKELLSYLSPSIFLSIAKNENVVFQSLKNIILKKRTFNSFDVQADVPLVINDKISLIFHLDNDVMMIRGKSGRKYQYLISNRRLMNMEFCMFNCSANFILKKFGDTRERGILLPAIQSLSLHNSIDDCQFISQTDAVPLSLLKKDEMCFTTKKDNILWKSLLAERLGALSALQILERGDFDINTALISEKSIYIAYDNIIKNNNDLCKLPLFVNKGMLNGPFKNGIIATFLCFSYYKDELLYFLGNEKFDADDIQNRLKEFSIPNSSAHQVNENIDKLIEFSLENDSLNSVPWF